MDYFKIASWEKCESYIRGDSSKSCGEIEYGGCKSGHLQSVADIELWIYDFLRFLGTDFSSTQRQTLELN